ncbi:MAG: hypothetical protein ACREPE_15620 [Lysobacter sp.]
MASSEQFTLGCAGPSLRLGMVIYATLQQDIEQFAEQLEALARNCSSIDEVYDAWKAGWRTIVGGLYDVDREWLA